MSDIQDSMGFGSGTAARITGLDPVKRRGDRGRGPGTIGPGCPLCGTTKQARPEEWET
jgi:hypothetical protein